MNGDMVSNWAADLKKAIARDLEAFEQAEDALTRARMHVAAKRMHVAVEAARECVALMTAVLSVPAEPAGADAVVVMTRSQT